MNIKDNLSNMLENISGFFPLGISLSIAFLGLGKVKKVMINKIIDDCVFSKKDFFYFLIGDRVFIESLSDDEIKEYYKLFKQQYKSRVKQNIKNKLFRKDKRYKTAIQHCAK